MNNSTNSNITQRKILLVWELGSNLGHLFSFKHLAIALRRASFDVLVAAKELHQSERAFHDIDIKLVQAPVWLPKEKQQKQTLCMPDILLQRGYDSFAGLQALVKAWRALFDIYSPDLVVFDYAPTALLAAKTYSFKKIVTGVGFGALVPGTAAEKIFPAHGVDAQIQSAEARAVDTVNKVANRMGIERINFISDLFVADKVVITNMPELDMYASKRIDAAYVGPLKRKNDSLPTATWPDSKHKFNIFTYLNCGNRSLRYLLPALAQVKANMLIYIGGGKALPSKPPSPHIKLLDAPTNLDLLRSTDLAIVDGGTTIARAISEGVPVLASPGQLEQRNIAKLAEKTGAARIVRYSDDVDSLIDKINLMLNQPSHKIAACNIAMRYPHFREDQGAEIFRDICIDLLH